MSFHVDNTTFISSNSSSNTLMESIRYKLECVICFYIQVIVLCIIVLPLNMWTLWLIKKGPTSHRASSSSDLLHFNAIFASVIFCIGLIFKCLFIICIANIYLYYTSSYIRIISLIAQIQFHTWIFVEHYLAIVHPIFYLKLKQSWYKIVRVCFTWVTASVCGGSGVFIQKTIFTLIYVIHLSGLIVLIFFCGMATLATLKKPNPGEGEGGKKLHHPKMKAFRIITLTLGVLIFSYSPYICFTFIWQQLPPEVMCTGQAIVNVLLLPGIVFHSYLYISRLFRAQRD